MESGVRSEQTASAWRESINCSNFRTTLIGSSIVASKRYFSLLSPQKYRTKALEPLEQIQNFVQRNPSRNS
jgi:hypothetical protein